MRRIWLTAGVVALAGGGAAALATAAPQERAAATESATTARALLRDAEGRAVGSVLVERRGRRTFVTAQVRRGVEPGFHGFHVHQTGVCEPPFTSAGGHLALEGQAHREHAGDLPSLLVGADGLAYLRTTTDRFTPQELRDGDGSAFIVHGGADNFANIPERYRTEDGQAGPDAETLRTGDSGPRVACGVVR
jgi:Cu-Zn family superoxide dismutase